MRTTTITATLGALALATALAACGSDTTDEPEDTSNDEPDTVSEFEESFNEYTFIMFDNGDMPDVCNELVDDWTAGLDELAHVWDETGTGEQWETEPANEIMIDWCLDEIDDAGLDHTQLLD